MIAENLRNSEKCQIIAELGTLHHHSLESLKKATVDCIEAGADYVKIQVIDEANAWWADQKAWLRYANFQVKGSGYRKYFDWVKAEGLWDRVFASYFDVMSLKLYGDVPLIKLGYKAIWMPGLIRAASQKGQGVIISLGDDQRSAWARGFCHDLDPNRNTFFYQFVQPVYPTFRSDVRIPLFGFHWEGLSIHCKDPMALRGAFLMGAKTLEIHVKGIDAEGPDCEFAISVDRLKEVVRDRDLAPKIGSF